MAICIGCNMTATGSGALCDKCRRQMEEASEANAAMLATARAEKKSPCECGEPCISCGCN